MNQPAESGKLKQKKLSKAGEQKKISLKRYSEQPLEVTSEERFRFALYDSNITLFAQNLALRYTWLFNPSAFFPGQHILGKTDNELFSASESKNLTALKNKAIRQKRDVTSSIEIELKGEKHHFELNIRPNFDKALNVNAITCYAIDTTHFIESNQQTKGQFNNLFALFNLLNDGVLVYDDEKQIKFYNQKMEDITGYTATDVENKDFLEIIRPTPNSWSMQFENQGKPISENISTTIGCEIIHKDRKPREVEIKTHKLIKANNVLTLVIIRDISDTNRVIQSLLQSQNLLETKLQAKTEHIEKINSAIKKERAEKEIIEQRAKQVQEEVTHLARVRMIGDMASGLAHEIIQPLTAIHNYAQGCISSLQQKDVNTVVIYEAIKKIAEQANRASDITRNLRKFVCTGETKRQLLNINDLILEATSFIKPDINRMRVYSQFELAQNLPQVMVDSIAIEQVLLNILRNALDAMVDVDKEKRILNIQSYINNTNQVEICIEDSGEGLHKDISNCVFNPFFTTKFNGMGMGLAISKTIIETHGGNIWLKYKKGEGAKFFFALPILKPENGK